MWFINGILAVLGRLMIAAIFLMSAFGNKIPKFQQVVQAMTNEGVPQPKILLAGAIAFLVLGGLSIVLGYRAKTGALLLLIFLAAATYYFHDFWKIAPDDPEFGPQMIQFMKNLALMGTMVFLIGNGPGPWSLDGRSGSAIEGRIDEDE
ncbi:MAG: DoxX family protein [Planctomycetia bacterium]